MKTALKITRIWMPCAPIAAAEGAVVSAICNKLESEIAELDSSEKAEFLAKWA